MKICCAVVIRIVCYCLLTSAIARTQPAAQAQNVAPESKHATGVPLASSTGFSISEERDGLTITFDGKPYARYIIDQVNKPYLWPIYGPTGKPMTRAYPMEDWASEGMEQRDHPHHRGLLFGHESIGLQGWKFPQSDEEWRRMMGPQRELVGGDTWHEPATFEEFANDPGRKLEGERRWSTLASIQHREFTQSAAHADRAVIVDQCDYVDRDGKRFLTEQRRMTFRASPTSRIIDFDQTFTASDGDVVFDDRKDAGLSIRVPTSMAVDSGKGGHIINSEGSVDNDAWSRPAKWCDYHGPVNGEHLGIAFLNHPSSFRFPTRWHVRSYGLFTANPFASKAFDKQLPDATTTLKQGEQLKLKHRFIFHGGDATEAKIEEAWQQYAKESVSDDSQ